MLIKRSVHVGFTVADMDRSVAFYSALLDDQPYFRRVFDEEFVSQIVGYPRCKMEVVGFNLPGTDMELELLHYHRPSPGRVDMETYNVGNGHLCLEIDDWDAAYERLQGLGAEFRHPEAALISLPGPFRGARNVYLRDPDGITIELTQPPLACG